LGVSLRELTSQDRQTLRIPQNINGILVTDIKQNGLAANAGIVPQDIIIAANLKPVKTIKELTAILDKESKERGAIVLQIYRQGNSFIVTIPLDEKK
jgi:serine protease Do